MDLSVVIVSWNVREKLKTNLSRLFLSETGFKFEVFVVDNASTDGTAEMVKKEFPQVHLIANSKNVGFARANNQALRLARGDYFLLLNPDMKVLKATLDNMVFWMKTNRQVGLAGCRLMNEKGDIVRHVRRFPTVWNQLAIILKLPHLFKHIIDGYLETKFDYDYPAPVDTLRGSFMMIRRSLFRDILPEERFLKEEFLDERYFVWFEDVDLCRTVKQAEKEVWYTPVATCQDDVGASFKQLPRLAAQQYFRASMLKYFRKWHKRWQSSLLALAWPIGLVLTFIFEALGFQSKNNT